MQPSCDGPLASSDYERILTVLGECADAGSLAAFHETLLESLATHFGYQNAIMRLGPTRDRMYTETSALRLTRIGSSLSGYVEHYHRWNPLPQPARRGTMAAGRTLTLHQPDSHLTAQNQLFLAQHLRKGAIRAVLGMEAAGDSMHLGLALFSGRDGAFGARDVAVVQRLGRLLTRQAELLTRLPAAPAWTASLTRRETEVARLVTCGRTNQEIAAALYITTDTVKKHVKAACAKAGAVNRAGLAAKMAGLGA